MYLVKRNKVYHLLYKDENGKLYSKSTKCIKKIDASRFSIKYLHYKIYKEDMNEQPETETGFGNQSPSAA